MHDIQALDVAPSPRLDGERARGVAWWRDRRRVALAAVTVFGAAHAAQAALWAVGWPSWVTVAYAIAVGAITASLALHGWNQRAPHVTAHPAPPADPPPVALIIPTCGEPLEIIEATVRAAVALRHPAGRLFVYLSDDSRRDSVRALAERLGVTYNRGARTGSKAGNLNGCLDRIRREHPGCDLVLTQDADEIAEPDLLEQLLGYMQRPNMGFVQGGKDCFTPPGDPFGCRDRVFYDHLQRGRDAHGATIACGSAVIWRISALDAIGGFADWNVVEDLTTSYELQCRGYDSAYHAPILTRGLSPEDIPTLHKQRGTWAVDTFRLLLFANPLLRPGLSWPRRWHYLELCLSYLVAGFAHPLLFAAVAGALLFGPALPTSAWDVLPIAGLALALHAYGREVSGGDRTVLARFWQYATLGHAPIYLRAFFVALRSRGSKPRYRVTRKTRLDGFHGTLLWPQFAAAAIGAVALVVGALSMVRAPSVGLGYTLLLMVNGLWLVSGVLRAAFVGLDADGAAAHVPSGAADGAAAADGIEPRLGPAITSTDPDIGLQAAAGDFLVGACTANDFWDAPDASSYIDTVARQFGIVTPENQLKWDQVAPTADGFDFAKADRHFDFARQHGMRFHGHPLAWHRQLPAWLTDGEHTPAALADILERHVDAVVGHYRGAGVIWDVVNEAFLEDGTLRPSIWSDALGRRFVDIAFHRARAADETAVLLYNDYNLAQAGPKADAVYALVGDLIARDVPIDGVGFQMHIRAAEYDGPAFRAGFAANMQRLADLGLALYVTEMDVRLPGRETPLGRQLDARMRRAGLLPTDGADVDDARWTRATLEWQARIYADVAGCCRRQPACRGLQVWGVTDAHSWAPQLFEDPYAPLLFDADYRPKPAYFALRRALAEPQAALSPEAGGARHGER